MLILPHVFIHKYSKHQTETQCFVVTMWSEQHLCTTHLYRITHTCAVLLVSTCFCFVSALYLKLNTFSVVEQWRICARINEQCKRTVNRWKISWKCEALDDTRMKRLAWLTNRIEYQARSCTYSELFFLLHPAMWQLETTFLSAQTLLPTITIYCHYYPGTTIVLTAAPFDEGINSGNKPWYVKRTR